MSTTFTAGKLSFVRYATGYPGPALDLGQRRDQSALDVPYLCRRAGGPGLPFVDLLRRNLSDSLTIKPVFITGGKGAYDDLAIATGLAAWAATNGFPELLLEVEGTSRNSIDGEGALF